MPQPEIIRLALLQLNVTKNKKQNVQNAIEKIRLAAKQNPKVIVLPECFNCPYGTEYFDDFSESVPDGPTCQQLSAIAKELGIHLIGGSIIEKDEEGKLFNTCTIWSPKGELLGKHRKVHLGDVDIKGVLTFKESEVVTPGSDFTTLTIENRKLGIGICNDIRFEEFARVYRNEGCDMLIYPSTFEINYGKMYWELLQRARAADNQLFVATASTARDENAPLVAYGHSMVVDPWGKVLKEASEREEILITDIDFKEVDSCRQQVQLFEQRRTDMYDTIKKE